MKKSTKAVIFDMDGVICDNEFDMFDSVRKTLKHKGVEVSTLQLIDAYMGMTSDNILTSIIEKYNLNQTVQEFRNDRNSLYGNYYADAELVPMPGLYDVLDYLNKHEIRMAVVTSSSSRNALNLLNRLSVVKYVDVIISGDMIERPKPFPDGYQKALNFLQLDIGDVWVIEDSKLGIDAAKNAGLKVVGFAGSEIKQDISKADIQIASFKELLEWIKHWLPITNN